MIDVNIDSAKLKDKILTTVNNSVLPIGKGQLSFDFEAEVRRIVREEVDKDTGKDTTQRGPEWLREVGGKQYTNDLSADDADHVVRTTSGFLDALDACDEGDVIWIPGGETIDLSGHGGLDAADDVTIASNRCIPKGLPGGRIKVDSYDHSYIFKSRSENLRITGLRIEGPIPDTVIENYDASKSVTLGMFLADGCRFDNLEVYGWPFAGFCSGAQSYTPSHTYDHNHFHDNMMDGLGYGVELYNGHHTFHHNYFEGFRHAISAYGHATNGYEAYHNVVSGPVMNHGFDMHARKQNQSHIDSWVAGGRINIHDNLFTFTHSTSDYPQEAIKVRGIPDEKCTVKGNYFAHKDMPEEPGEDGAAYRQTNSDGEWQNFEAFANTFNTNLTFNADPLEST